MQGDIATMQGDIVTMQEDIATMQGDIKHILHALPPQTSSSQSPLALTELGRAISSELRAEEWASVKAETLLDAVRDKEPYDIQTHCFSYAEDSFLDTRDHERQVKELARDHGLYMEQVLEVVGIELRDAALELLDPKPSPNALRKD